ncbi:MAG: family hydrolase [Paucimonas sp.]|nr:family hydrolase [Paucimonas sp.]
MPAIKAILFDLDDTLWPIAPVIARAEEHMYDWLRTHVPAVAARFTVEALRARRMEMLNSNPQFRFDMMGLRQAGLAEAFRACEADCDRVEHALEVFRKARNTVDMYEDVRPVLPRLANHWTLGTISNGPADLEQIGISHHFQASVAAWRFGSGKPDPKIFLAACELLAVAPQEAVYVGDDPLLDVEGAQQAGLKGVWLDRVGRHGTSHAPGHLVPDAVCTNLFELEHWLHTICGTPAPRPIE